MREEQLEALSNILLTLAGVLVGCMIGLIIGVEWYDSKYRPGIEKYLNECSQHFHQGSGHASDDR